MVDVSVAESMVMPEGDQSVILQFNRTSGALVTHLLDLDGNGNPIDLTTLGAQDLFVYVREQMNWDDDVIIGNYPDYQIVAKSSQPETIYESGLDAIARDKITKLYPVIQQVNILGSAIVALCEKAGVDHEGLSEMLDYIAEVKAANTARKEFYAASEDYDYITIEQEEANTSAQLDGGVHELYGARATQGGSVFGE